MTNIYWPVYRNLEDEMDKLFYSIHIDDSQLNVYSSKIADLILRSSAEIESISKELYKKEGGSKPNITFDDAIKYLNKIWLLDKKVILISSSSCFQTKKILTPFIKNERKTSNGKLTYSWNNSYQNLKHDRANSLPFGSLKYLFDIMSALFILNIYFKNEVFELKRIHLAHNFPLNLGSKIFSIKLHKWKSYDGQFTYMKDEDFDQCIYWVGATENSLKENKDALKEMYIKQKELFSQHPKFLKYIKENKLEKYDGKNLMWDVLGKEDYWNLSSIASKKQLEVSSRTEYEAVLNKNCI